MVGWCASSSRFAHVYSAPVCLVCAGSVDLPLTPLPTPIVEATDLNVHDAPVVTTDDVNDARAVSTVVGGQFHTSDEPFEGACTSCDCL